jgi:hypothetical protein
MPRIVHTVLVVGDQYLEILDSARITKFLGPDFARIFSGKFCLKYRPVCGSTKEDGS